MVGIFARLHIHWTTRNRLGLAHWRGGEMEAQAEAGSCLR